MKTHIQAALQYLEAAERQVGKNDERGISLSLLAVTHTLLAIEGDLDALVATTEKIKEALAKE